MSKKDERLGERFTTNEGYKIVIIKYNSAKDVTIQFQDKYKTILEHKTYQHCKEGKIKNPYHPTIYGVGYLGEGKYKAYIKGKQTKEYIEWNSILQRCYDEEYKKKYPTYRDVVIDEWFFNFQNYCSWREQNYYEIDGERMELDKDILYKGNKEYAPDKCIFVPKRINNLFTKSDAKRGSCPIGVTYHKRDGKYQAQSSILNGKKYLGSYNTLEEAFQVYKQFKETYIKQIADEYRDKIPQELYNAMYNWEVEITD